MAHSMAASFLGASHPAEQGRSHPALHDLPEKPIPSPRPHSVGHEDYPDSVWEGTPRAVSASRPASLGVTLEVGYHRY